MHNCLSYTSTVITFGETAADLQTTGQFYFLYFRDSDTSIFSVIQEIFISNYRYNYEVWVKLQTNVGTTAEKKWNKQRNES
jgi:hypothetical protein